MDAHSFAPASVEHLTLREPGHIGHPGALVPGTRSYGDDRASHVPGEPWCAYALLSDPGGTGCVRPLRRSGMAPVQTTTRAPTNNDFRGSITRLRHWLSTLRSGDYSPTTQDSLPGAGQALPGGIGYPQGSAERFQSQSGHLIPLSQAFVAQGSFGAWRFVLRRGGIAAGGRGAAARSVPSMVITTGVICGS